MEWIKRLFRIPASAAAPGQPEPPAPQAELHPDTLMALARLLALHEKGELNCYEVSDLLCQFGEMDLRGEDPADQLPEVDGHLKLCGDCREEYEALLRILQAQQAG